MKHVHMVLDAVPDPHLAVYEGGKQLERVVEVDTANGWVIQRAEGAEGAEAMERRTGVFAVVERNDAGLVIEIFGHVEAAQ